MAVNSVETKFGKRSESSEGEVQVLGWDAFAAAELPEVDYVVSLTNSDQHIEGVAKTIKPQSAYALSELTN